MTEKRIIDLVSGNVLGELSNDSIKEIMEKWDSVFCPLSKLEKGQIQYSEFKWHVFSSGIYSSEEGSAALDEYRTHNAREFYVIPEINSWPVEAAFLVDKMPSPDLVNELKDIYIFPKNLAWTMVFTHEYDWLGPYFAKNKSYAELNKKNLQSVQAKQHGW